MSSQKTHLKKIILTLLFVSLLLIITSPIIACFTIVVGKDASADGCVLVAHNEDDNPPQIVNHEKNSRGEIQYSNSEGNIIFEKDLYSYIVSQIPDMDYSDSYLNEWGVCITSNNCPSKEEKPQITQGGLGKALRHHVARVAKTARDGVLLAGQSVEQHGYLDSGRTYTIADPNEGWLFCAVKGKHWIAQRVQDNQVAMVSNTYSIRKIDLKDSNNFLASKDIVDYAISRNWYNPEKDGEFDFAKAYANPKDANSPVNYGRQWAGLKHITNKQIPLGPNLPFSVVPNKKIKVADLMQILRYDNTTSKPDFTKSCSEDQLGTCIICRGSTQTSFVAQLRKNMPADIGFVYWVCLAQPGASIYIPFHFGSDFPAGFICGSQRPSEKLYNEKINAPFKADPNQAWWTFANLSHKAYNTQKNKLPQIRSELDKIEQKALSEQKQIEDKALEMYKTDNNAATKFLTDYSNAVYLSAITAMDKIFSQTN